MKFNINIRRIKKLAKSLKISTSKLEIKAKKEDYTIADAKGIILLLQTFFIYAKILIFLAALGNKL